MVASFETLSVPLIADGLNIRRLRCLQFSTWLYFIIQTQKTDFLVLLNDNIKNVWTLFFDPIKKKTTFLTVDIGWRRLYDNRQVSCCGNFSINTYESHCEKAYLLTCAPNEDSNQFAYARSLIRIFIVRMKKIYILRYPRGPKWRVWPRIHRLIWILAWSPCPKAIFGRCGSYLSGSTDKDENSDSVLCKSCIYVHWLKSVFALFLKV